MNKEDEALKLVAVADELRPPIQAFRRLVVDSAKVAAMHQGGSPDEIWAATVINVADGLGLDINSSGQMSAAVFVAESVMYEAGIEGADAV